MILKIGSRLQVQKSSRKQTSFSGLPLLSELAHQSGVIKRLDSITGLLKRRKYSCSDYVMGLTLTLIAGGERLSDTRVLREDCGLRRLIFDKLPAANSLGRFLKRFTHRSIHHLAATSALLARMNIKAGQTLTLDLDATLIESEKEKAKNTYKGFRGYNPILAWSAETNFFLAGVFREGNASPQCHLVSLLKYCRKQLPDSIQLRLRSDSAGYRLDLMKYCHFNHIPFAIGADLDHAVQEAIDNIPQEHWRLVVKNNDPFLLAETIHVPGGADLRWHLPAFRLIVTRKIGQLDLFKPAIKYRAIISSLPTSMKTEDVLDFYNGRGSMEKAIGELKHGFGLDKLPSGELFANAAFLQICILAYNLVQLLKCTALPEEWRKYSIKNLRFLLLGQAAVVVRHARRLILKLAEDYPFFDHFQRARWAILSPTLVQNAS